MKIFTKHINSSKDAGKRSGLSKQVRLYQQSVRVLTLESAVALSGEFEALLLMDFRGVVF